MTSLAAYDHHVSFPPWFLESELPTRRIDPVPISFDPAELLDA